MHPQGSIQFPNSIFLESSGLIHSSSQAIQPLLDQPPDTTHSYRSPRAPFPASFDRLLTEAHRITLLAVDKASFAVFSSRDPTERARALDMSREMTPQSSHAPSTRVSYNSSPTSCGVGCCRGDGRVPSKSVPARSLVCSLSCFLSVELPALVRAAAASFNAASSARYSSKVRRTLSAPSRPASRHPQNR